MEMKIQGLNYSNNPLTFKELNAERFLLLGYQMVAVVQVIEWFGFRLGEGRANPTQQINDDPELKATSLLAPSFHTHEPGDGACCCRDFFTCIRGQIPAARASGPDENLLRAA